MAVQYNPADLQRLYAGLQMSLNRGEILERREARNSLLAFTQYTKRDFQTAVHHKVVASHLEAVERGEIKRLMIWLPPRHSKSELASRRFPAWYLGRNPQNQVIAASYNADLAATFGRDVRNLVADERYRTVFPGVSLRQDSKAADRWNTTNGGAYISAGVGSGITGYGAHLGIIDDPFKDRKEASSLTVRDNVWDWYRSAFYTRLMPGAGIVMPLTRWHEDDLAGRLLAAQKKREGEEWVILNLPAIATGPDLLGRSEGEALWPEWYPLETLLKIRQTIGNYEWASLYQQSPETEEGNIFKRHWWEYYREVPPLYETVIQSWDTAFKEGEENDYSVCTTWGMTRNAVHLMDRWKDRVDFPDLKKAFTALAMRHKPHGILVEDKASGQSLIQELKRATIFPVIPFKPDGNKVARAHAVTPLIESGRVFLPEWASWVSDYVQCMSLFPSGAHDDDIDSTTAALLYLKDRIFEDYGYPDEEEDEYRTPSSYCYQEGRSKVTGY
jgi:predicted phage terminase large subunit-like protein